MKKFKELSMVAMVLLVAGGLNWGSVGLFNIDVVGKLFGSGYVASFVYLLIGVSAVYVALTGFSKNKGK